MDKIMKSRRFWLLVLDAVISIGLMAIGTQFPAYLESTKAVIGVLQPVVIALIAAWTVDDTAQAIMAHQARMRYPQAGPKKKPS